MGTAASVEGAHIVLDPSNLPINTNNNSNNNSPQRRTSETSSRMSSSSHTLTSKSVRAMALMNHSRQENSYIHADTISSHLIARGSRRTENEEIEFKHPQQTSKNRKFKDNKREGGRSDGIATLASVPSESLLQLGLSEKEPVISLRKLDSVDETKVAELPAPTMMLDVATGEEIVSSKAPELQSLPSLSTFRSNFNLKLNLGGVAVEDPPTPVASMNELSHEDDLANTSLVLVDHDDHDDTHDINQFDAHRIALPMLDLSDAAPPVVVPIPKPAPISTQEMNVTQDGALFVDGMQMGVGEDGIIRPNREMRYGGRLPMRERLIILCKLGSGASSAVYKALDLVDMRLVALKTIQVYEKEKRVQMVRELTALFQLLRENSRRESSHLPKSQRPEKYIVDFYDAFSNMEDGLVCMMIEYMDGGSLQDIVDQGGCDDESTLANIAVQALKGLNFLHNNNQIHRDLKPGNFLISHRGEVKVADLGILKQLPPKAPGVLQRTNTFVGTATYMSPERIDGKDYSFPSDVWAFGLSMITLAMGTLPIDTQGGYWTILHSIRDAPPPKLPKDRFSTEFCDFVDQCVRQDPDKRASCKQLLKHPFMNKVVAEDLSYAQSYERGKNELLSIIRALIVHIDQLRKDVAIKFSSNGPSGGDNVFRCSPRSSWPPTSATIDNYTRNMTASHEKLFGNLLTSTTEEVVLRLLFDEVKSADGKMQPKTNSRPRLTALARQLHLPLDKVIFEAKTFCESLKEQYQQDGFL